MTGAGPLSAAGAAATTGAEAAGAASGAPPTMASADTGAPPEARCGAEAGARVVVVVPPGPFLVLASVAAAAAAFEASSPFLVRLSRFRRPVGSTITRAKKSVSVVSRTSTVGAALVARLTCRPRRLRVFQLSSWLLLRSKPGDWVSETLLARKSSSAVSPASFRLMPAGALA
ncbi:hypothetical protein FQZ97_883670 [compost metagenome]